MRAGSLLPILISLFIQAVLAPALAPALAQPIFSRAGDGTMRNVQLTGGIFANPLETLGQMSVPTTKCAGNGGPGYSNLATGAVCLFMQSSGKQTYLSQFSLTVPANSQASAGGADQVALYSEVRLAAFSAPGWSQNPLIQANTDSGTAIISEFDLNNLSGCDSGGVDNNTTGGTSSFVAARSDGSVCPQKIGLLVTGVASNTSTAGLQFQYVSNGTHAMWQDGIRMLGGYMAAEYEWVSDTQAPTAFKIKGVHGYYGLGLESGGFGQAAISLSSASASSGKILWHCPDGGCTAASGYPTSVALAPNVDGGLHLSGAPLVVENNLTSKGTTQLAATVTTGRSGLIVGTPAAAPVIMSGVYAPSTWTNYVSEWAVGSTQIAYLTAVGQFVLSDTAGGLYVAGAAQFGGTETHGGTSTWSSLLSANGGIAATNYILQYGGAYIFDNQGGSAASTIYYDQANSAIKLSAPGFEVAGSQTISGNLSVAGSLSVSTSLATDVVLPGATGKIAFGAPVQLPSLTVAALPSSCTAGELAYATDGRKPGEAAGAGSGIAVLCTPLAAKGPTVWSPVQVTAAAVTK